MANVIKNRDVKSSSQDALKTAEFSAGLARVALDTTTQKHVPETAKKKSLHPKLHRHEKSLVEKREEATRKLQGASGTITGVQAKTNRQLTANRATINRAVTAVEDAWEDPHEVTRSDDLETALEKRYARISEQDSRIESSISLPDFETPWQEVKSDSGIGAGFREHGLYGPLEVSSELLILLNGVSEIIQDFLNEHGQHADPLQLNDSDLFELFSLLKKKNKKTLSEEEEEEAELVFAGAVGILALPKIIQKLQEIGLPLSEVKSLTGKLHSLLQKAQEEDSQYHHLYSAIKESAELNVIPEEEDVLDF